MSVAGALGAQAHSEGRPGLRHDSRCAIPAIRKTVNTRPSEQQGKRSPVFEMVDSVGRAICDLIVLAWRTSCVGCYLFTVFSGVPEANGGGEPP